MGTELLVPLIGVFLSVALAVGFGASYFLRTASPLERRLRDLVDTGVGVGTRVSSLDLMHASYGQLEKFANVLPQSPKQMSALRRRMAVAGFDRPEAAVLYALAEIGLPILFGSIAWLYLQGTRGIIAGLTVGAVGYLLPGLWLGSKIANRKRLIQNGLPDALDLLLVTIEAGSGLDQALVKVSNELQIACPPLADELRNVVTEMRAGRSRIDALKQLAERTKVDDVRTLVATMIQTDKFGTSIGQALRTHADVARTKRRQRAEERAQKLGVKLVFPLVLCLFPAMYVVVLGPAALRIMRLFATGNFGR
jgi:tight adherence protein C